MLELLLEWKAKRSRPCNNTHLPDFQLSSNISKNLIIQVSQCLCACVWLRGIFCRSKVVKTRHAGLSCFVLRLQIWHNWKPLYHCNEIPLMFLASHLFWQAEYDSLSQPIFHKRHPWVLSLIQKQRKGHHIIKVTKHKTGLFDRAKMIIPPADLSKLHAYLRTIRPGQDLNASCHYLLCLKHGK